MTSYLKQIATFSKISHQSSPEPFRDIFPHMNLYGPQMLPDLKQILIEKILDNNWMGDCLEALEERVSLYDILLKEKWSV